MGVGGELSRHPDYLLASMDSRQWAEWVTYRRHYPSLVERLDINSALERLATYAAAGGKRIRFDDLHIKYGKDRRLTRKYKTAKEQRDALDAWK
jgi:hypothetical protein